MSRKRTLAAGVLGVVAAGLVGVQLQAAAGYRGDLACETEAGTRPDAALRVRHDCSELRMRLVDELAHGRMPLATAADLLLDANHTHPDWLDGLDAFLPDDRDRRTRTARTLVVNVEAATRDDPSRQAEALARLPAELDRMPRRPD